VGVSSDRPSKLNRPKVHDPAGRCLVQVEPLPKNLRGPPGLQ
jgi:hypothetical protein